MAPLLGQRPLFDHLGSVAPESWLRLYHNGQDIPSQLTGAWLDYSEPALVAAETNAAQVQRYPSLERSLVSFSVEADGIRLSANWGGELKFYGDYDVLEGVYTVRGMVNAPRVTYLGEQQDTFQSYIGPGGVGVFQPLMEQLRGRYDWRHPRIGLRIPQDANYVMFTYPPMPFDINDGTLDNLGRPIGGTVRLAPDAGMLSQDLTSGGAFPLRAVWQDADQSAGPFLSLLPTVDRFTPPEYVVPAGIAYDPCFLSGSCGDGVLQSIHNATMMMRTIYLRVEPQHGDLTFVPLKAADETWSGQAAAWRSRALHAGGAGSHLAARHSLLSPTDNPRLSGNATGRPVRCRHGPHGRVLVGVISDSAAHSPCVTGLVSDIMAARN